MQTISQFRSGSGLRTKSDGLLQRSRYFIKVSSCLAQIQCKISVYVLPTNGKES